MLSREVKFFWFYRSECCIDYLSPIMIPIEKNLNYKVVDRVGSIIFV